MKRDILAYVTRCLSCQHIKAERIRYPGKLHPHDIPQMKWENISMDFVTGLPTSKGYDFYKNSDIVSIIKNSKKILKIIKFGVLAYFDIKIKLNVRIDHLDTEKGDTDRIARFFRAMHIIVAGLYIYIYI